MHAPAGFLSRIALVAAIVYVAGCGSGDGVREDRSVHSTADGGALSFQHGNQGVYVSVDGQLQQVYQPNEDVLATSTPLWAPDSSRMIFTVATAVKNSRNEANVAGQEWDDSPDGRVMQKRSIRYACRMHVKDAEGGTFPMFCSKRPATTSATLPRILPFAGTRARAPSCTSIRMSKGSSNFEAGIWLNVHPKKRLRTQRPR